MESIRNTCVLVKVTVGKQTNYILDKQITSKVEGEYSTHGRGQWKKRIFKDCAPFKEIMSISSAISAEWRNRSLDWDDSYRVLLAGDIFDLLQDLGSMIEKKDELVDKFVDNYDNYVTEDIAASNGMMTQSDYPDKEDIKEKFYTKIKVAPIPEHADFRVMEGISQEEADQLVEMGKREEADRIAASMGEAHRRLYDSVGHLYKRLSEYNGAKGERLHKSLIGNVVEQIELLKKLNISGDKELESTISELERNVLPIADIDRLKVLPEERKEVVDEVNKIMNKMRFFGKTNNGEVL